MSERIIDELERLREQWQADIRRVEAAENRLAEATALLGEWAKTYPGYELAEATRVFVADLSPPAEPAFVLSDDGSAKLADLLANPPEPSAALRAAAKRHGLRAAEPAPSPPPEMPHPLFRRMERLSDELCQTQAFILRALERAGLHVIDAEQKAVLDACEALDLRQRPDGLVTCYGGHRKVELAELARRAAKEGSGG